MKKVFITGMSGVGKTTVAQGLRKNGIDVCDIDDVPGLCGLYDKRGELVENYERMRDLDLLACEYLCDKNILGQHMAQTEGPRVYVGFVDNSKDIFPLFDHVILLKLDDEIEYRRRLSGRTTTEFGKNPLVQDQLLAFRDEWIQEVMTYSPDVIDTDGPADEVVGKVLDLLGEK